MAIPWTAACQAPLSFTIFWSLLKFMSIELVTLSNHLTFSYPLLLLPSIFPSIRVFSRLFAIVAKFLELQHQFFQWIFRVDFPLGLTGLVCLLSKGFLEVFSSTVIRKHQKQEVHTLNLIWFRCSFFHYWEAKHLYSIQP